MFPATATPEFTPIPRPTGASPRVALSPFHSSMARRILTAARRARRASSPALTGTPNTAMSSSPTYLSTTPPSASTASLRRCMHWFRNSMTSWGSMPSVNAVKPRTSANRTVTWRFSPPSSTPPSISSSAMSRDTTLFSTERYRSFSSRPRVISLNASASLPTSSRDRTDTSVSKSPSATRVVAATSARMGLERPRLSTVLTRSARRRAPPPPNNSALRIRSNGAKTGPSGTATTRHPCSGSPSMRGLAFMDHGLPSASSISTAAAPAAAARTEESSFLPRGVPTTQSPDTTRQTSTPTTSPIRATSVSVTGSPNEIVPMGRPANSMTRVRMPKRSPSRTRYDRTSKASPSRSSAAMSRRRRGSDSSMGTSLCSVSTGRPRESVKATTISGMSARSNS